MILFENQNIAFLIDDIVNKWNFMILNGFHKIFFSIFLEKKVEIIKQVQYGIHLSVSLSFPFVIK